MFVTHAIEIFFINKKSRKTTKVRPQHHNGNKVCDFKSNDI